jgi:hypothetical protein
MAFFALFFPSGRNGFYPEKPVWHAEEKYE